MVQFKIFQTLPFLVVGLFLILPLMAQEPNLLPEVTAETTAAIQIPSPTPSPSPTSTGEVQDLLQATPSAEFTEMMLASTEATALVLTSPEATESILISPELTPESTLSPEITESVEATELAVELTDSSPTQVLSPILTESPTQIADRLMRGMVRLQGGQNHAGIRILANSEQGWTSQAFSDEEGFYSLELLSAQAFQIEFSAANYLRQIIWIVPGDSAAVIELLGGDLNADDCINQLDLDLLIQAYHSPLADIDKDGISSASDLAILTGNYDRACGMVISAEGTEASESTAEASEEAINLIVETSTAVP